MLNNKTRAKAYTSEARKGFKYRQWANAVKKRDKYICQHCGTDDIKKLQAHHKIPWEDDVDLRFEISNGLTLCRVCHTKEDRRIKPLIAWNKGIKLTQEHRKKLSDAKKGKKPWNAGKKMNEGYCKILSESRLGKPSKKKGIPSGYKGRSWKIDNETGKRVWFDK